MHSVIIVCDAVDYPFGDQGVFGSSSIDIDLLADRLGIKNYEVKESLLHLGGELAGNPPVDLERLVDAVKSCEPVDRIYSTEGINGVIEDMFRRCVRNRHEVFCSFSLIEEKEITCL